jgi:hypothetical protein
LKCVFEIMATNMVLFQSVTPPGWKKSTRSSL